MKKKRLPRPARLLLLCSVFAAAGGCNRPAEAPAPSDAAAAGTPRAPAEAPPAPPAPAASPFLDLQPGEDGFVPVPLDRISGDALFVNVPKEGEPTVQLLAVRDGAGRARIAFNTCQACNPSPRAFFAQTAGGRLVCQSCGNSFAPEAVGAAARGCNPAAIPGLRETDAALLVPAAALDAARPAFRAWAGPRE